MEQLLTIEQAAEYLNVSATTMRRIVDNRQIRHTRAGSGVRIRQQWIDEYIDRNSVGPRGIR